MMNLNCQMMISYFVSDIQDLWNILKIGENVPNLEIIAVVLVQCNLADNK